MAPLPEQAQPPAPANLSWIGWCAALLLAIAAIAAPLAFGATEVHSYCALQVLVAVATILWIASGARPGWPVWLPLAVAALGAAQLVPLSADRIQRLSPLCANARKTVEPLTERPIEGGVSVNAARTFAALRRCLMLAAVVVVVSSLARSERTRLVLLGCVALAGVTILLLGLIVGPGTDHKALGFHDMDGVWKFYKNPLLSGFHSEGMGYADVVRVGRIHYVSNSPVGGVPVGAMINANHFAACIGMTLPVVVGLLLAWSHGRPLRAAFLAPAAMTLTIAGTYAIAVPAQARAASAALCVMTLVIAALALARKGWQGLLIGAGMVVFIAAGLFVAVTRFDLVGRLGARYEAWQTALEMFREAPWLGVGLGNFGTVYPGLHDQQVIPYLAHNAWVECVAEAGLAGIGFALAATVGLGWCFANVMSRDVSPGRRIVRLAAFGGILFAALHGATDHGIQIPANAYLCATLIGILLADLRTTAAVAHTSGTGVRTRFFGIAERATMIGVAGLLLYGGLRESEADRLARPLRLAIARQCVPDAKLAEEEKSDLIRSKLPDAEEAFRIAPQDADVADWLGQGHLHLSRGTDDTELRIAAEWFGKSLALSPVNPWTRKTLGEIRDQLENPQPLPEARRPRRNAPREPTQPATPGNREKAVNGPRRGRDIPSR